MVLPLNTVEFLGKKVLKRLQQLVVKIKIV